MLAIEVKQVYKEFKVGAVTIPVLNGVSFGVAPGELVGVVGESGSGKSTLLHVMGTLDTPTSGQVVIGGHNPLGSSDRALSHFRNRSVGFVFQHNNLLAEFSALENVMMPALIAGFAPHQIRPRAQDLLTHVGLGSRLGHFPGQLSGGEQQRVAIARALINGPTLVLADEPSGNLDSRNARLIHDLFIDVNRSLGTTVLIVTHNMEFANRLPRTLVMQDGRLISG